MKNSSIFLIVLLILFSCNSKDKVSIHEENGIDVYPKSSTKKINNFLEEAINDGNIISYKEVASIYFDEHRESDFYFYAMMMANKHNYSRAYYDLYIIMSRKGLKINNIEMYSSDKNTTKLANYFLIKSYELGLKVAKTDLKGIFGENIPTSDDFLCK